MSKGIGRTFLLFSLSLPLLVLSLILPAAFVHTYCENRPITAFVGALSAGLGVLLFKQSAEPKALRTAGIAVCALAFGLDALFFGWTTQTCTHMFDQLK